jgi:phage shock protein E
MKRRIIAAVALFSAVIAANAPAEGGLISPAKAKELLASEKTAVLLDVRTAEEFSGGDIASAILLPYDAITASSAAAAIPGKQTAVIVYCRSGRRSAIAADTLRGLGYARVWDLGGIGSWPYGTVHSSAEKN